MFLSFSVRLSVCLFVCLSAGLKKLLTNLDKISEVVGRVTSNSWLDFGGNMHNEADIEMFKGIFAIAK